MRCSRRFAWRTWTSSSSRCRTASRPSLERAERGFQAARPNGFRWRGRSCLQAPILVLDEPSSSLDPETEALLDESIQRLGVGRTVLTIAHRLNSMERADRIIVLEAGRIVESGTHTELLVAGGSYSRLLDANRGMLSTPGLPAPFGSDSPVHVLKLASRARRWWE